LNICLVNEKTKAFDTDKKMSTQSLQMINLSIDDLSKLIKDCFKEQLKNIQESKITEPTKSETDFLTRKEVKNILNVSYPTLWKYNNEGTLKVKKKIGRRVYYSKQDLNNLLNDLA